MPKILDLRKKGEKEIVPPVKQPQAASLKKPGENSTPLNPVPEISWHAPSFYYNPQKRYLAVLVIALALGGGGMLIFHRDTLTAIFLLLSSFVLVLYSNKRPEISRVIINQSGVVVGDNLYYYKDLRSFWIHYHPGDLKELSLESKRWYLPHIKVSLENENPLEIRSLLINFLAEKEHERSLIDIFSRKIGL